MADSGQPRAQMDLSHTQSMTIPYDFEPFDFENAGAEHLDITLVNIPFINTIGSITATVFKLFDTYKVLAIITVLLLALSMMGWIFNFINQVPARGPRLDTEAAIGAGYDLLNLTGLYQPEPAGVLKSSETAKLLRGEKTFKQVTYAQSYKNFRSRISPFIRERRK